jgi:hypothetical protein
MNPAMNTDADKGIKPQAAGIVESAPELVA